MHAGLIVDLFLPNTQLLFFIGRVYIEIIMKMFFCVQYNDLRIKPTIENPHKICAEFGGSIINIYPIITKILNNYSYFRNF